MSPLCSDDRRALLELARWAIVGAVCHDRIPELAAPTGALAEPSGAFVSLHFGGRLRGCVGQVRPTGSLAATVVQCSIGAARADPRFRPVEADEVAALEVEISVLSDLKPIHPDAIEVGRHGLVVTCGQHRGVLLPQVAVEHHWTRECFLKETCAKAGLEPDSWQDPASQLWAFTAEVFSEKDFPTLRRAQN